MKTISITNKWLQYLYILIWRILAKDIATIRKINQLFKTVEPVVSEYERQANEFLWKWKEIQQLKQFAAEKFAHSKTEDEVAIKDHEEKMKEADHDLQVMNDSLVSLNKAETSVSFEIESFAFLTQQLPVVIASVKNADGTEGISWRADLQLIEEVFDAIEAAK